MILLCGIKHCGKSSIGQALAQRLNGVFADTDQLLEARFRHPVRELFREWGEELFREREQEILLALPHTDADVIALGGGALKLSGNSSILRSSGILVWLDIPDKTAFARIVKNGLPPFLEKAADPFAELCRINDERRKIFAEAAHCRFDVPEGKNAEACAELLESFLKTQFPVKTGREF